MSMMWKIPDDPFRRFADVYAALDADRSWFEESTCLKFAAVATVCSTKEPAELARKVRAMAEEIKQLSGWFGALNSPLRFIVSALLVICDDTARAFIDEVERVGHLFKEASLKRRGIFTTLAILILRLRSDGKRIEATTVKRLAKIYREMKACHWWLTGEDDYPACAILVHENESAASIGKGVEDIYQALRQQKFYCGNPLQSAANILYLTHQPATTVARRFREIADKLRQNRIRIFQSDYDELALLTFLDHRPSDIAHRVVSNREKIRQLKPKPSADLSFNLACSISFFEMVRLDRNLKLIQDAKILLDMQAIIAAQQAAAVAAAGAVAATAASSSGG